MPSKTRVLYVQLKRVNVRREPRIAEGNIVDFFTLGDPLEILTTRSEKTPDGWVWRRLAESDECWVAEYNTQSGDRLWALSDTPFDVGIGDSRHGMDPYAPHNKPHYAAMKGIYKQWAERL